MKRIKQTSKGFSIVEIMIVIFVVSILFTSIAQAYQTLAQMYGITRQLNEMYAVLSSCPEIDRALQYDGVSSSMNCFPLNVFEGEGATRSTIVYTPTVNVTAADSLPVGDPLRGVPEAKVIDISVQSNSMKTKPWDIRLLITRNGIAQQ